MGIIKSKRIKVSSKVRSRQSEKKHSLSLFSLIDKRIEGSNKPDVKVPKKVKKLKIKVPNPPKAMKKSEKHSFTLFHAAPSKHKINIKNEKPKAIKLSPKAKKKHEFSLFHSAVKKLKDAEEKAKVSKPEKQSFPLFKKPEAAKKVEKEESPEIKELKKGALSKANSIKRKRKHIKEKYEDLCWIIKVFLGRYFKIRNQFTHDELVEKIKGKRIAPEAKNMVIELSNDIEQISYFGKKLNRKEFLNIHSKFVEILKLL